MGLPPSVTKIKKGNIEFVSSVDRVNYTIQELTRAALKDVGRFVCNKFRNNYYQTFRRNKGKIGRYTRYGVRKEKGNVYIKIGLWKNAFYGGFQELGTSRQPKHGLLNNAVLNNIGEIIEIQSKYLSALEDEARALSLISDDEYEGGADGDT